MAKLQGEIGNFVSTPQALAEMSEERFAEILNELQARGDKEKLKQLFGHRDEG